MDHLIGDDGSRLSVRRYVPSAAVKATLVVVHGYLEHGGRYEECAQSMAALGFEVVVADLRGHGLSEGPRGHVNRFKDYRDDLSRVVASVGHRPVFVLGHSLGGLIALDFALADVAELAGLVVTNPYVAPAMHISPFKRALGSVTQRFWPTLAVRAGLSSTGLTHDQSILAQARKDPLMFDRTTARWFHEVSRAQERAARGGNLAMPFLGILGTQDPIADPQANRACFARITQADKTVWERQGELHEVLNEPQRLELFAAIGGWLLERVHQTAL